MNSNYPRAYYEQLLRTIPSGAEQAVLSALSLHIGLEHSIKKPELMAACKFRGFSMSDERQLRTLIVKLRKAGIPVCASSAESGYYLAASMDEYTEFVSREYMKKITDMSETVRAMDNQVKRLFPDNYQAMQPSLL